MNMKALSRILFVAWMMTVLGCATGAPQTQSFLNAHGKLPAIYEMQNVAFLDQAAAYCGPASLSMVMHWAGKDVLPETLAAQMLTPDLNGSLQNDMIGAARRNGMMAVTIHDLPNLLAEVSGGHPVIIIENLGLSWFQQWHYAVVIGYDLNKKEIILHSGHRAFAREDLTVFENSWRLGEYWGLVVLRPGELAITADERAHVTAAAGLELVKKNKEAMISYRRILKKWPKSLVELIGMANVTYACGNKKEAAAFLRSALKYHPHSEAAKHNLKAIAKNDSANRKKPVVR